MSNKELDQCKYAASVFYRYVTSKETRLKNGAKLRQKIKTAATKGKKLNNYRTEWFKGLSDDVLRLMIKSSEKFNNTHFNDMISTNDFLDILESLTLRIKTQVKKKQN